MTCHPDLSADWWCPAHLPPGSSVVGCVAAASGAAAVRSAAILPPPPEPDPVMPSSSRCFLPLPRSPDAVPASPPMSPTPAVLSPRVGRRRPRPRDASFAAPSPRRPAPLPLLYRHRALSPPLPLCVVGDHGAPVCRSVFGLLPDALRPAPPRRDHFKLMCTCPGHARLWASSHRVHSRVVVERPGCCSRVFCRFCCHVATFYAADGLPPCDHHGPPPPRFKRDMPRPPHSLWDGS